jgi:hypothetical protein
MVEETRYQVNMEASLEIINNSFLYFSMYLARAIHLVAYDPTQIQHAPDRTIQPFSTKGMLFPAFFLTHLLKS